MYRKRNHNSSFLSSDGTCVYRKLDSLALNLGEYQAIAAKQIGQSLKGLAFTAAAPGPRSASSIHNKKTMLLCQYRNPTQQLQIARITDGSKIIHGERVVLPQQRITFHAKPEAILEIITGTPVTSMVEARIPCKTLCSQVGRIGRSQKSHRGGPRRKRAAVLQVIDLSTDKTLPKDRGDTLPKFERV